MRVPHRPRVSVLTTLLGGMKMSRRTLSALLAAVTSASMAALPASAQAPVHGSAHLHQRPVGRDDLSGCGHRALDFRFVGPNHPERDHPLLFLEEGDTRRLFGGLVGKRLFLATVDQDVGDDVAAVHLAAL